jgi:outer membrane protein assembly factor BamB
MRWNRCSLLAAGLLFALSVLLQAANGSDWSRFRGPNGSGVAEDSGSLPTTWSPDQNLAWKVELPGPGSSSPIVVGDRVFVTCWSGYGTSRNDRGDISDLVRHLICFDAKTGRVLWDSAVKATQPEEDYRGNFAEHGYASHTPVSDGDRVYVFFGKSGALAFDMAGKQLWQTSLGTGSNERGWGSASSPILFENLVIVTASSESNSMAGLVEPDRRRRSRVRDLLVGLRDEPE